MYGTGDRRYCEFCAQAGLPSYPTSESADAVHSTTVPTEASSWVNKELSGSSALCPSVQRYGRPRHSLDAPARICDERDKAVITSKYAVSAPNHPKHIEKVEASMAENGEQVGCQVTVGSFMPVFFAFLRSREVVMPTETEFDDQCHLCFEDISVDDRCNPSYLQVTLKASKTDPYRQGVKVHVGKTDNELCPVAAVVNFMPLRGDSPGPLFKEE